MTHGISNPVAIVLSLMTCNLAVLADKDWDRFLGPHGVAVVSIIAVIALWAQALSKGRQERKDKAEAEAARERRHSETLRLQRENSDKILELSAESIKAHARSVQAITSFDRTIQNLTEELKDRPCQLSQKK